MHRCEHAASGLSALSKTGKTSLHTTSPEARAVLDELMEKCAQHGTAQFVVPDILKVPPISNRGNMIEVVANYFGGAEKLREAVNELQTLLYAGF